MVLWIGEKKGGYLLKFQQKGLKEVHLLTEQINFPVAIAIYNDWEKTQVQYLLANIKSTRFTSYSICRWCIVHKIQYQILYPIRKISILRNPYKYYQYIKLLTKLNKFSLQNSWFLIICIILSKKKRQNDILIKISVCLICLDR